MAVFFRGHLYHRLSGCERPKRQCCFVLRNRFEPEAPTIRPMDAQMAIRMMNRLIYLSLTNLLLVSAVINLLLELIHLLIVLGQIKFWSRKVLDFKRIQLCFFLINFINWKSLEDSSRQTGRLRRSYVDVHHQSSLDAIVSAKNVATYTRRWAV